MSSQSTKLQIKLTNLDKSLDELESVLEPLFAQSLPESLANLEPIQQAKLQTVLPYLVYDLVFIYLKTKGIDPKSHPVFSELDRVRQYFEKIANTEKPKVDENKPAIDKAAANRFIKHAIAQVSRPPASSDNNDDCEPGSTTTTNTTSVPLKITDKMRERELYEQELKEQRQTGEEEEDEDLQIHGDTRVDANESEKAKGKKKAAEDPGSRKRRQPMDPFAGYGNEPEPESVKFPRKKLPLSSSGAAETNAQRKVAKKAKWRPED